MTALRATSARTRWSDYLGVLSLTCLAVLAVTGVILLWFYEPSTDAVSYEGSYAPLRGMTVSQAYASTLEISFDVPGGLLVRQMHHWAALLLPACLMLQMLSTYFAGAFRRPHHWRWVLLSLTFILALGAGWSGYALPDDLLAGTGLRIVQGLVIGTPVVGSGLSFLTFGGEFPGEAVVRMYWLHVAIIPALLVMVLALRLVEQRRRRPRTFPAAYGVGLSLIAAGVIALMGGLVEISPVWLYGPASSAEASAGSQPDWYMAFLDGALRLVPPGWEVVVLGRTVPLALLVPQAVVGIFVGLIVLWPFVERRAPHGAATRAGLGAAGLTFYLCLWLAASTDIVTTELGFAFESQVRVLRSLLVLGPAAAFVLTRELHLAATEARRETALHGIATGQVVREPDGGYTEVHAPPTRTGQDPTDQGRTSPAPTEHAA